MRTTIRLVLLGGVATVLAIVISAPAAFAVCGDYNDDGAVSATDALGVLSTAVGYASCALFDCDVDDSGAVTAVDALAVLTRAVGLDVTLVCPIDPDCVADLDFFFESVWTPVLTDCIGCHNVNGLAATTDHVLRPSSEDGYLEYNFDVLRSLASITEGKNGRELLLTKPLGINHVGGQRLGMTEQSPLYANLVELLDRFDSPTSDCGGAPADFWAGVSGSNDTELLRKAALIFAGRLPTAGERTAAASGDEAELRRTIRDLMTGEGFEAFLTESANDQLLTDQFLLFGPSAFDVLVSEWEYPYLLDRVNEAQQTGGDEAAWQAYQAVNRALTQEPLRLIANVVTNERPYTEILTADYMMVNPWSASVYQPGAIFADENDETDWREGAIDGYRLPGYPHAGILSSPMLLGRYPSTATNRNRARARWVYKFFLAVDIEGLAARPIDPDALADDGNPTMDNPHCAVCHSVHDPVAGTFQNFGDEGLFREWDIDSLPWSYKDSDLYQPGDLWYRDMRSPGFNNVVLPALENDQALRWLATQFAADPRFAMGAVKFWFPGVFGRQPLVAPVEAGDADYSTRLRAFAAQDEVLRGLAYSFRNGTAGTAEHGTYNLKDMLVEMVMSPIFRATAAAELDAERSDELAEIGLARLLTPEQLHRKVQSVTGYTWAPPWAPDRPELLESYRLFYGGIDSAGITARATEINALMNRVTERLAAEAACPIAVQDFSRPAIERRLFPLVEPSDTPATAAGRNAILANLVHLHDRLLGESLAADDAEPLETYALFEEIWQLRSTLNKSTHLPWGPAYCSMDFESGSFIESDDDHTIRSWISVLIYMMGDYKFLHE